MKSNQVIVVEGKNDQERISRLFKDVLIVTTNGSEISKNTIDTIVTLAKTNEIILLLDPDSPGEKIRSIITNHVPNAKQAFIRKSDAISKNKKKVGIEHASNEIIIKSLENLITLNSVRENKYNFNFLVKNDLAGSLKSAKLREIIANKLNIGNPNAKTFLKRINAININEDELENLIKEVKDEENRDS